MASPEVATQLCAYAIFLGLFWQGLDKGFELGFALGYPDLGQVDLGLT